ncbi:MAG: Gfo/Idh/MocA family oxidoreductase [Rhodothermales bacterium]
MDRKANRRTFLKTAGATGVGLGFLGGAPAIWTSGGRPADKIVVGVMGVNSRGHALAQAFARQPDVHVGFLCDVDAAALGKCSATVAGMQDGAPKGFGDIRKMLESNDLDAVAIAVPDHWHTTAALMAMSAGKHVYLEKPGSHNPQEAHWLVEGQRRHNRLVQLGTQRRSSPVFMDAMAMVHDGMIGEVYLGKAWYANTRGSIGRGQPAAVPDGLDYALWQGPAPRRPFRDNLIHYNWHWFRHWGTGEACNNGTHHIDICRWALGVDYPTRVTSAGGRFAFQDDWEFFDTQIMSFEFAGGKTITWEGRSCNGMPVNGKGFGVTIHGTGGSLLIDSSGYTFFDAKSTEMKTFAAGSGDDGLNPVGGGEMTDLHVGNFCEAIRGNAALRQPIAEGYKSAMLCHLGNIAQFTTGALQCDPASGAILHNDAANALWGRTYEPGWEPRL